MIYPILKYDEKRTPFDILGLEANTDGGTSIDIPVKIGDNDFGVGLKGIIDRIEEKDGVVRIIDYKTGSDKKTFSRVAELFDRQNKQRNKAVFQTLFYSLLYAESGLAPAQAPIQASLFNIRELFSDQFSPLIQKVSGRQRWDIQDVRLYLQEFQSYLQTLLAEIFDDGTAFSQTDDATKCRYCAYTEICNR